LYAAASASLNIPEVVGGLINEPYKFTVKGTTSESMKILGPKVIS